MRIAYVCPRYPPLVGGVETHVAQLASHAVAAGCEAEVLTQQRRPSAPVEERDGVVVRRFAIPLSRERYVVSPALLRELRASGDRFDVVHAHDYSIPAVAAAVATSRPLVFTPHYHGLGRQGANHLVHLAFRPLGSLAFRRAARVICVSRAESELVAHDFAPGHERIAVVPNGTSISPCPEGSAESERALVVLGRLKRYKRVDLVLRALAELPEDIRLEVVGDGSARGELVDLADELGVAGRTTFTGTIPGEQLRERLCRARALVTMSSHEAFGLAPLDALAAGLPVVASDIPAHRELSERLTGTRMTLVAPQAPPLAVAQAIGHALEDPSRAPPDGLPTWERVARMTLEVYRAAAAGAQAGRGASYLTG